jgi:hypothetical protein
MDEEKVKILKTSHLKASVKAEIEARPTNTFLADHDAETRHAMEKAMRLTGDISDVLPEYFDGRVAWEGLLTPVMNQGGCGSCWAFASTSVLAHRFNIQSLGLIHVQLSPTKLILCDWEGEELDTDHPERDVFLLKAIQHSAQALKQSACYGNTLLDAARFLLQIGTPTEECVPYNQSLGATGDFQKIGDFSESRSFAQLPLCTSVAGMLGDMCSGSFIDKRTGAEIGVPERFYRCLHYYGIKGVCGACPTADHCEECPKYSNRGGEWQIRNEIWKWGTVASGMKVYPDFYTFDAKNGIYEWNGEGPQVGGHAIEIVGWGKEKDRPYWIIRNSWGVEWGDKGYFKMVRGNNNCHLEENCIGMIPDFFYPAGFQLTQGFIKGESTDTTTRRFKDLAALSANVVPDGRVNVQDKKRNEVSNIIDTIAGGIDPSTGYTRRAMIMFPWMNFQRPVPLEDLPRWGHFVAGEDATLLNRVRFQAAIHQKNSDIRYGDQTQVIYVSAVVIIGLGIAIVLFLLFRHYEKKG